MFALWVFEFHWGAPWGRRGRCVHWVALWGSSGSFGVTGFIVVRPSGLSGSFRITGFIGVRPGNRWIRSGSLGSLGCALGVVGFVRGLSVHW